MRKLPISLCLILLAFHLNAQSLSNLWSQAEAALAKDQPKTALTNLSHIYTNSVSQAAWGDAIIEAVADILAQEKKNYSDEKNAAFREKADQFFTVLLSKAEELLSLPFTPRESTIGVWDIDDTYRKTVYDYCVWKAIEFYGLPDWRNSNTNDHFRFTPDMPLYAEPEAFMAWAKRLPTGTPGARALILVAGEMRRHQKSGDMLSYADADFNRLKLVCELQRKSEYERSPNPEFDAALSQYILRWEKNELSARVRALQALRLNDRKKYDEAIRIAEKGMDSFPKSLGAQECYRVIQQARKSSFSFSTKSVWTHTKPEARPHCNIRIYSQNISKAWFRLYPLTLPPIPESSLDSDFMSDETRAENDIDRFAKILPTQPAYEWEVDIISTNRQYAKQQYDVTTSFKLGAYLLVGSTRKDFRFDRAKPDNNHMSAGVVQVTDLACLVTREAEINALRILNMETGQPIPKAAVTQASYYRQAALSCLVTNGLSDFSGVCRLPNVPDSFESVKVTQGDDTFLDDLHQVPSGRKTSKAPIHRVLLLTDRSVYRPGQTLRYKGIYYSADTVQNQYAVRPDASYTLAFLDTEGRLIESRRAKANEFGSFSGLFVIPADRGTGEMKLQMADAAKSSVSFRVEEKHPDFEVVFDPITTNHKIGDAVKISGRAASYSGRPVDCANIQWQVREAQEYPLWYARRQNDRHWSDLAEGDARIDTNGVFTIEFLAAGNPNLKPENEPRIHYAIRAQVTDATGETRENETEVTAGFSTLLVKIASPDWFLEKTDLPVTLQTTNLKGEPCTSEVTVTLYSLTQPARPTPLDKEYDYDWLDYDMHLAHDPNDMMRWPAQAKIMTTVLTTDQAGRSTFPLSLTAGVYRIEGIVKDASGNVSTDKAILKVFNPKASRYPICQPADLIIKKKVLAVGETFEALWGTGYNDAYGMVEVWVSDRCIKRYETRPQETQIPITFPVTEDLQGGFTLCSKLFKEGLLWKNEERIDVPWSSKNLRLHWTQLNPEPIPNTKETWTLSVKNLDNTPADAEVVVCMYDAAINSEHDHNWSAFNDFRKEDSDINSFYYNDPALTQKYSQDSSYNDLSDAYRLSWSKYGASYPSTALYSNPEVLLHRYPKRFRGHYYGGHHETWNGPRKLDDLAFYQKDPWFCRFQTPSETAFFRVALRTDAKGEVIFSFTVPNVLARWTVLAFAHDKQLASGLLQTNCVTHKKVLLAPEFPRFLRAGDTLDLSVAVVNRDSKPLKGLISFSLTEVPDNRSAMYLLKDGTADRPLSLAPGASDTATWRLNLPVDKTCLLNYLLRTKDVEDGWTQEGTLPVLPRSLNAIHPSNMESLERPEDGFPLFKKNLLATTATLPSALEEYTGSQRYAVLTALPYLLEAPLENGEQLFHHYYASTIARLLLQWHPDLNAAFTQWRTANKKEMADWSSNAQYRARVREESPSQDIALDARSQMCQMAGLFDLGPLATEQQAAFNRLKGYPNSWFRKSPYDPFLSLSILQGFVRLRQLGVNTIDEHFLSEFIASCDNWYLQCGEGQKPAEVQQKVASVSPWEIIYLYSRSALLTDFPCCQAVENRIKEHIRLATADCKTLPRLSRAHLAIALKRIGDQERATALVHALRDEALRTPEAGMYWAPAQRSSAWYDSPIETQTVMIEAFLEVTSETDQAEACAHWLLTQRSAQHWPSSIATAHAVYALLRCTPTSSATLTQAPANTAKKSPFQLTRTLFRKEMTPNGVALHPATNSLNKGDILLTRLEVVAEEEMDYVHILDARAANTEPVSPLTTYHDTETLAYTLMPSTTATHFFIARLPKGRHTFEHACRITQQGTFSNGPAFIQCMYAPEFNAHSESGTLTSKANKTVERE
jgi:hypothetical protein